MVCIIIDANLAFCIFTSVPEDDFRPVFDWLHAPDKNGCVVYGGKLAEELSSRTASRQLFTGVGRRQAEPVRFLMALYKLKKKSLHAVDFVSRTILT